MIATLRRYVRGLTSRFNFRDSDEWQRWGYTASARTDSGITMDRATAMTCRLVWQCVNIIADDVAKTPIVIYRNTDANGKVKAKESPYYDMLRVAPNPFTTSFDFWKSVMADALLGHGAYIYLDRDPSSFRVTQLIRLLPDKVTLESLDNRYGTLEHRLLYRTPDNELRTISFDNIIKVTGLSYDGMSGLDLTRYAKNSFGYALAVEKYGNRFFGNGAEPRVVLKTDKKLTPEAIDNIRKQWNDIHQGLDNSHKTAILQLGLEMQQLTIDPKNSQLIEAKQWSPKEIAGWFKVPPNRVGAEISTSYASLEQEDLRYVTGTLDPWLYSIEQQLQTKLLNAQERQRFTIEFMRQALIRADMKSRYESYAIALAGHPFMEVNEARSLENMAPSEIEGIQIPTNNFGDQPGEASDTPPAAEEPEPEPTTEPNEAARELLREEVSRMWQRVSKDARQYSKNGKKFYRWIDGEGRSRHFETVSRNFDKPLQVARADGVTGEQIAERILDAITSRTSPIMDTATNDSDLFAWVGAELDDYEELAVDDVMAYALGG